MNSPLVMVDLLCLQNKLKRFGEHGLGEVSIWGWRTGLKMIVQFIFSKGYV